MNINYHITNGYWFEEFLRNFFIPIRYDCLNQYISRNTAEELIDLLCENVTSKKNEFDSDKLDDMKRYMKRNFVNIITSITDSYLFDGKKYVKIKIFHEDSRSIQQILLKDEFTKHINLVNVSKQDIVNIKKDKLNPAFLEKINSMKQKEVTIPRTRYSDKKMLDYNISIILFTFIFSHVCYNYFFDGELPKKNIFKTHHNKAVISSFKMLSYNELDLNFFSSSHLYNKNKIEDWFSCYCSFFDIWFYFFDRTLRHIISSRNRRLKDKYTFRFKELFVLEIKDLYTKDSNGINSLDSLLSWIKNYYCISKLFPAYYRHKVDDEMTAHTNYYLKCVSQLTQKNFSYGDEHNKNIQPHTKSRNILQMNFESITKTMDEVVNGDYEFEYDRILQELFVDYQKFLDYKNKSN